MLVPLVESIFPFLVSAINSNLTELAKYVAQLSVVKTKVQHVDDFEISQKLRLRFL